MARPVRIEFPGAHYHVFNRGNYRKDLFTVGRTGEAFESALLEACGRFGWVVHAWAVMSNHYHLALETPAANLSQGMQWLQGTFANRFNRFSGSCGHVFQGRYKSPLVEPGPSLLRLVNYIHLNPVRAEIVDVGELLNYRLSSLPRFLRTGRPPCLSCERWLAELSLRDRRPDLRRYLKYLVWREEGNPAKAAEMEKELCRGWYIGSEAFGREILEGVLRGSAARVSTGAAQACGERYWEELVDRGLEALGKSEADLSGDKKSERWKVALAAAVKFRCNVGNAWLADRLHMGGPSSLSRYVSEYRRRPPRRCPYRRKVAEALDGLATGEAGGTGRAARRGRPRGESQK